MSPATPRSRRSWLITGVAGFIGSHLLESLLTRGHRVAGLDNYATGRRSNLEDVRSRVGEEAWSRYRDFEGDITRPEDLARAIEGAEIVLHQAALGSVPLSIEQPAATHASNVTGFVNVLEAARGAGVSRVIYASSSAVYGDCDALPAREDRIGRPLSPYALSKSLDEQYAAVFERCYGLRSVGLRYFNVCGPRQDPAGAYAAVIPRWIDALVKDRPVEIYGDGETSRDFCPVANVVHANLLAATVDLPDEAPRVFNVGLGAATSLNQLFELLRSEVAHHHAAAARVRPLHREFRSGDIRHSFADITALRRWLGFEPVLTLEDGLVRTVRWYAGGTAG